jgi:hypothetical protein
MTTVTADGQTPVTVVVSGYKTVFSAGIQIIAMPLGTIHTN